MAYIISIILDKRRTKDNGKFPVKLRVYNKNNNIKKVKFYPLDLDLTEQKFNTIWVNPENKRLRGENSDMRLKLQMIETKANAEAKQLAVFDFSRFETILFRKSSDKNNVKYHFELAIKNKLDRNKIGTAESYRCALNSLTEFSNKDNNKKDSSIFDKLTFEGITVDWLKTYENYMLENGKSFTTVAIYTRTLRVVFNNAIENNDLNKEIYPFGKNKYKIPKSKKVKKALSSAQLTVLFDAKGLSESENQAKDFWFFSYACNGMNFKDIALLKYSDIKEDRFSYYRAKTLDKTTEKTEIVIYLTDFTEGVIAKYGNRNKTGFVFNILSLDDTSREQYRKIKNFTRMTNQHLKKLAIRHDLPDTISGYWARHSFATNSLRKGATMEFISEALNHSDLSVTKNYFAGFEDKAKKEFANSLLDF